jgi:hypothetical protein
VAEVYRAWLRTGAGGAAAGALPGETPSEPGPGG